MAVQMRSVFSSTVKDIGYDEGTAQFYVTWLKSGKTSVYDGVPADIAEQVNSAPSIGSAVIALLVKGGFAHAYEE